jgi:hypothetical protein
LAESTLVITQRGLRLLYALAAIGCALVALLIGSLIPGDGRGGPDWIRLAPTAALAAAPCPSPTSADLNGLDVAEVEAARTGEFEVFGPEPTTLKVPIDWTRDPLGAHRYRENLQKLRFLAPLLASYRDTGNTQDLKQALSIALDWVARNPRGAPRTPVEAWSDKVVGDRVPFLAYLLRATACENVGSPADRRGLLDTLEKHGRALASSPLYTPDNHGLFVDLGLVRLANFLPFLEPAEQWRALARERFERTLRGRLDDGIWLEHSSAYQFLAIRALERMIAAYGDDPELDELLAQMRSAAGWFVKPDGEMTQFGDSNQERVPDWAAAEVTDLGLHPALAAGFAFVRAAGSNGGLGYLAVAAGFHNTTHKHADELSFELFDGGQNVVADTGLYDKDPGPIRDFVVSNRAHSTLVVDGLDWPITDPAATYGSGLVAAGQGDGWYAIEVRNPLLEAQGVEHRRLFLYRPGEALVIIDRVTSDQPHTYTRYLHLGSEIKIRSSAESVELEAGSLRGAIMDAPSPSPISRSQARGQDEPRQGFTSPAFRKLAPRWTIAYVGRGSSETFATTIALDGNGLRAEQVDIAGLRATVSLADRTGTERTVEVSRGGTELSVADTAR